MRHMLKAALVAVVAFASMPAMAAAVAPETAKQYMTDLGNRAVDTIAKQPDPAMRRSAFIAMMLDSLDFDALGTFAIGKIGRSATPEEKRAFKPLFAAYVIDVAIQRFGDAQLKSFGLGSATPQPNGDVKVFTRLVTSDPAPMEVHWRVHDSNGQTRITDIEVAGYSLAMHYRGDFERAGIGTMSGAISRLQELTKASTSLATVQQAMK